MYIFYVYAYIRQDGSPYYIGKGKNRRAWSKDHNVKVPSDTSKIVLLETNLSELGALAIERRMIKWYGRKDISTGILRNMTDGGDMPPNTKGIPKSIEHNRKNSEAHKGVVFSEETLKKMSDAKKGKVPSATFLRRSYKGEGHPNFGKKMSEEQKVKIRESLRLTRLNATKSQDRCIGVSTEMPNDVDHSPLA
jgi:hypothetical protein